MLKNNNITKTIPLTKSVAIPINNLPIPLENTTNINKNTCEYSLMQTCFDPLNHSPPNDFMCKLQLRISVYNSHYNKTNNCENE
jgi:hypothetical protein